MSRERTGQARAVAVVAPILGAVVIGGFVAGLVAHHRTSAGEAARLAELTGRRVTLGIAPHDGRVTFLIEVDAVIAGPRDGRLLVDALHHADRSGLTWPLPSDADLLRDGIALHRVRWVETPDGHRVRW